MSKAKVAVVVDSTAYIPQALIEQHNIHVIPLLVNWSGESLRDNVDITPNEFYARLETAKEMPSTSQPSAGEFYDLYSKVAEEADSIVSVPSVMRCRIAPSGENRKWRSCSSSPPGRTKSAACSRSLDVPSGNSDRSAK